MLTEVEAGVFVEKDYKPKNILVQLINKSGIEFYYGEPIEEKLKQLLEMDGQEYEKWGPLKRLEDSGLIKIKINGFAILYGVSRIISIFV